MKRQQARWAAAFALMTLISAVSMVWTVPMFMPVLKEASQHGPPDQSK